MQPACKNALFNDDYNVIAPVGAGAMVKYCERFLFDLALTLTLNMIQA
jgi:hypothetical protein